MTLFTLMDEPIPVFWHSIDGVIVPVRIYQDVSI